MTLRSSLKTIADGFREAITGRAAPQGAEPYRGGEINRLNKPWQPEKLSGDAAINLNWDLLTRRIRDLGRNDPALIALKRAQLDHVVGDGIGTTAAVKVGDELDDEFNSEADEEWDWWLENEADVSGKLGWPDLQRQVYGEMLETGEDCYWSVPGTIRPGRRRCVTSRSRPSSSTRTRTSRPATVKTK